MKSNGPVQDATVDTGKSAQQNSLMKVKHHDKKPVMIIGHGSSGTSILGKLFRDCLGVAFGTESQFILRYYHRLNLYGDLAEDKNVQRLIRHLLSERWFAKAERKWGYSTTPEEIFRRLEQRTYRGVLDAIFEDFRDHLEMERYGDKTPEYTLDLPTLGKLYPDAKYIHMIRDGRDVAVSLFARYWGGKNIYTVARQWKREVDLVDRFVETLDPKQVLEITYEDMLRDPMAVFTQIVSFIEADNTDNALIEALEKEIPERLNRINFDKWKQQWGKKQQVAYEKIACDTLRKHGYETIVDQPGPECGKFMQLVYSVDNKARKLMYPRYWRDNVYKVCLRTKDAVRAIGVR